MSSVLASVAASPPPAGAAPPLSKADPAGEPAFGNVLDRVASRSDARQDRSDPDPQTLSNADAAGGPGGSISLASAGPSAADEDDADTSDPVEGPKSAPRSAEPAASPVAMLIALVQAAAASVPKPMTGGQSGSDAPAASGAPQAATPLIPAPQASVVPGTMLPPAGSAQPNPVQGQGAVAPAQVGVPATPDPTVAGSSPVPASPSVAGAPPEAAGPTVVTGQTAAEQQQTTSAVTQPVAGAGTAKTAPGAAARASASRPSAGPSPVEAAPYEDGQTGVADPVLRPTATPSTHGESGSKGTAGKDDEAAAAPDVAAAVAASSPDATAASVAPPANQIATAIRDLAASFGGSAQAAETRATAPAASSATPAAGVGPGTAAAPGKPLQQITIQLNPESLGSVSIRMRMAGDRVDIQIHVANSQTLDLLNKDRHVLSAAVEAAGGSASGMVLASAAGTGADANAGGPSGGAPGSGQQQALATGPGGGGASQRGARPDTQDFTTSARDEDNGSIETDRPRGQDNSVYL